MSAADWILLGGVTGFAFLCAWGVRNLHAVQCGPAENAEADERAFYGTVGCGPQLVVPMTDAEQREFEDRTKRLYS